MNVRELREELAKFPDDMEVIVTDVVSIASVSKVVKFDKDKVLID